MPTDYIVISLQNQNFTHLVLAGLSGPYNMSNYSIVNFVITKLIYRECVFILTFLLTYSTQKLASHVGSIVDAEMKVALFFLTQS